MGFGATTLHQTFYIRVGHVGESYDGLVDKILELQKRLPKSVFLIVFDECSMISRHMFAAICHQLEEAGIHAKNIGLILFGDPAQILPISGLSIWSTQLKKERKKCTELSVEGLNTFRNLMGMLRLDLVPGYNEINHNYKKQLSVEERNAFRKAYQTFGQYAYVGDYNAVYLDEIKMSDGSVEAQQFGELLKRVRYGKFETSDLNELKNLSATEKDVETDPAWRSKSTLTDFHFYSEEHPERSNADSRYAKALVEYSKAVNEGIMLFESIHTPAKQASKLETLNSKAFQGMANKLFLAHGSPVILTTNINPSIGLFNGSIGSFIGALYIPKSYIVISLKVLECFNRCT